MPTTKTAATTAARSRLTAKQRACPHPPANVHATYDDRWETCDLCHIIRSRPLPAPWIVAWDESQPTEQPPALFADLTTAPEPTPTRTRRQLAAAAAAAAARGIHEGGTPRTLAELRAIVRRDAAILGSARPWQSPPLDEIYTADQIQTCPRCRGRGFVRDHEELGPGYPWPTPRHVHHPADAKRTCPRCQGAGRIPKYGTHPD